MVVAERVAGAIRRRFPADVLAIAVHGPLAHGDDDGGGDGEVGMLVVTYRPGTGPPPATRRVDGVLVDLTVAAADDYLGQARVLSPLWPLTADRYVTTQALYDPTGWLRTLRDEHLGRLARARPAEFSTAGPTGLVSGQRGAFPGRPAGRVVRDRPGAADARRGAAGRGDRDRPAEPHLLPGSGGRGAAHRAGRRGHDRGRCGADRAGRRVGGPWPARSTALSTTCSAVDRRHRPPWTPISRPTR